MEFWQAFSFVVEVWFGYSDLGTCFQKKATFWVQMHDIPIRFMTIKVAEGICDIIGEINKSIGAVDDESGHFIRVWVIIDIYLPLCRGRVVNLETGEKAWVSFKYERLPNLCYWCGRLTHNNKSCNLWIQSKGSPFVDQQQFGPYLRAAPYQLARNNVIFIPGFFENRSSYIHIAVEELGDAPTIVVIENSNPPQGLTFLIWKLIFKRKVLILRLFKILFQLLN